MEEIITEEQKNAILKKRKEMLAKMGVPNAGNILKESAVGGNHTSSMAQKLAAIKNGSARAQMQGIIQGAEKKGFQGIPEPSKKSNNPSKNDDIKPEYKQELANFSPQTDSGELDELERMFTGGETDSRRSTPGRYTPQSEDLNLGVDTQTGEISGMKYMPTFNPQTAIQRSQAKKAAQQQSEYLKYASNEEYVMSETPQKDAISGLNLKGIQIMMETIAKGIAEKTIRSVLNEYSEQQKGKLFFEYYNKEQSIVKASDGKLYKLTPVTIKKK